MADLKSIGERIVDEIIKQGMVKPLPHPDLGDIGPVVFVWAANSTEQLSALVENELQVRLKLALVADRMNRGPG